MWWSSETGGSRRRRATTPVPSKHPNGERNGSREWLEVPHKNAGPGSRPHTVCSWTWGELADPKSAPRKLIGGVRIVRAGTSDDVAPTTGTKRASSRCESGYGSNTRGQ